MEGVADGKRMMGRRRRRDEVKVRGSDGGLEERSEQRKGGRREIDANEADMERDWDGK